MSAVKHSAKTFLVLLRDGILSSHPDHAQAFAFAVKQHDQNNHERAQFYECINGKAYYVGTLNRNFGTSNLFIDGKIPEGFMFR